MEFNENRRSIRLGNFQEIQALFEMIYNLVLCIMILKQRLTQNICLKQFTLHHQNYLFHDHVLINDIC